MMNEFLVKRHCSSLQVKDPETVNISFIIINPVDLNRYYVI